jgi:hypothetical protein
MRKRTLNPNTSHSQAAARFTSGYARTGITVARGIDRFDSTLPLLREFSNPLDHIREMNETNSEHGNQNDWLTTFY